MKILEAKTAVNMTYKEILPGINLRVLETDRFRTSCLSVQFISPLTGENAARHTLIPRILRRGTLKHPDMESLAAALDELYGAQIEAVTRRYGDVHASGFVCDFVEGEENVLSDVAKLLGEIIFEPKLSDGVFKEEFVVGERDNLVDEIKAEINNKLRYALKRATRKMFSTEGFAIDELGDEENAEKQDSASLYKHYKKMIKSAPVEVFFCGPYVYEDVEREIKKMFRLCEREGISSVSCGKAEVRDGLKITERFDVSQANLIIGLSSSYEDLYTVKLLSAVLGGGTSSKLFVNVRENASLCYFAGSMFDMFRRAMFMYCGIDPKNAKTAEDALFYQLDLCKKGDITDEEIKNAKKSMIDDLITLEDSPFSLESFWLRASVTGDERSPLELASQIKEIDGAKLSEAAESMKLSIVYLLTGMEAAENATKLLS